jgi:cyclophilin family peptidyl-prolyl cis-trans isomerase
MRPVYAIIALVLVAIGIAAYTASLRPAPDPTPQEKAQQEEEQARKDQQKAMEARKNAPPKPVQSPAEKTAALDKAKAGAIRATLEIEERGKIVFELYPKSAPKTVEHFVELCKKNFYEGIKVHRVEPGFVVQMGDPESRGAEVSEFESKGIGTHGSGTTVPLEANLPHLKGTLGLARSGNPDSGDSQFFINLSDNKSLDDQNPGYCVFGRIVEGEDIADKIQKGDRIKSLTVQ